MTPTAIFLCHCAGVPALLFLTAVFSWLHADHSLRKIHQKDMQHLIDSVKPAIRHNRSWPAIERAAEAIRVYEAANQPETPSHVSD